MLYKKTLDKVYNLYVNNVELKRAFFKQVVKGDQLNKQAQFLRSLISQKLKMLSEFDNGELMLEKRKLIESLDSLCKEVIFLFNYFLIFKPD